MRKTGFKTHHMHDIYNAMRIRMCMCEPKLGANHHGTGYIKLKYIEYNSNWKYALRILARGIRKHLCT